MNIKINKKMWINAWEKLRQFCNSEIEANNKWNAGGIDDICSEQLLEVLEQMDNIEKEMEENLKCVNLKK